MVRKRGERNFLREEYSKSWDYLKESKNFIYIIIGIFFVFSLIGFFVPVPDFLLQQILEFIEELLKQTEGMSRFELIKFIFFNNLQSSFFGMVLGFLFGIFSVMAAVANGYLLGFVASISVEAENVFSLWRVLPHGIFELPAIFISLGLGLKFGTFIFENQKAESFRRFLWSSLRVFLFIVVPLLIVAAIVEGSLIVLSS